MVREIDIFESAYNCIWVSVSCSYFTMCYVASIGYLKQLFLKTSVCRESPFILIILTIWVSHKPIMCSQLHGLFLRRRKNLESHSSIFRLQIRCDFSWVLPIHTFEACIVCPFDQNMNCNNCYKGCSALWCLIFFPFLKYRTLPYG